VKVKTLTDLDEIVALGRCLRLASQIERLDRLYPNYRKKANLKKMKEDAKREFWDNKIGFENAVKSFERSLADFVESYYVNPIQTFDGKEVILGFDGKFARGYRVVPIFKGEWLKKINFPREPEKLTEVFG